MPRSMYWVLERKTLSGCWHAALSSASLLNHTQSLRVGVGLRVGAHDPAFFAVLSGLGCPQRGIVDPKLEPFAAPGLPKDCSDYALSLLARPIATVDFMSRPVLSNPGHIYLGRLAKIASQEPEEVDPCETLSGNAPASRYLKRLYILLQGLLGHPHASFHMPADPARANLANQEILFGTEIEQVSGMLVNTEMSKAPQHTRLKYRALLSELLPCHPANLRLLIAYGP